MRPQSVGFAFALAFHGIALAALLSYAPARKALLSAAPIMVSLIAPAKGEEPKPAALAEQPKPRPAHRAKPEPLPTPVLTAPAESPSPVASASPVAAPSAPVQAAPAPVAIVPPDFSAAYLNNPAPAYPPMAKRLREQGRVVVRVLVNARGTADEAEVRTTSGSVRLDEAAREAVLRWKFVPARRGADAIAAWVLVPVSFRLEG